MEHVEYYELLEDLHEAVEILYTLDDIKSFYYYFDNYCNQWVLIYNEKED